MYGSAEWHAEFDALVQKSVEAAAKRVNPQPLRMIKGNVDDIAAYRRAVDILHGAETSAEQRKKMERKVAGLERKIEFGPVRKPRNLNVPHHFKSDYYEFAKWLVKAVERPDFVQETFNFWCCAPIDSDGNISKDGVQRVDLASLGFRPEFISRAGRVFKDLHSPRAVAFSPAQFLSAATEINLDRIERFLELLAREAGEDAIKYLSDRELENCVDACREWCDYFEPGSETAAAIVRSLFQEMNRCGIGKVEVAEISRVSEKTLDTWNHTDAEKRSPPALPKIAAALEAIGLRLMVVPEADVAEVRALVVTRNAHLLASSKEIDEV
jgi:hypothetical protein